MVTRTKKRLIELFTVYEPFMLEYRTLGHSREQWLADKLILDEMIKEGTVTIVEKKRNRITYKYKAL